MSIVTNEYFVGDIYLPQATGKYQEDEVLAALEIYEPEILQRLLGYSLWKLLDTAWKAYQDNPNTNPLPDRFDKLINGDEFTFQLNGNTVNEKWIGLRNDAKRSLLSYYTYFKYRNNTENRTTSTGEAKTKKENSEVRDSRPKLTYAYNRMIELYGVTPRPLQLDMHSKAELKEHFRNTSNYIHYNYLASCYNYLLTNLSTYPEWIFEPLYKINTLGI